MDPEDKQKLNPGQADIDQKVDFDNLLKAEKSPEAGSQEKSESSDLGDIKNQEEAPKDNPMNYREESGGGGKSTKAKLAGSFKKKGPIGLIIGLVLGGGIGITMLFSPAILIVQIKETMVGKFNSQLASMDARTRNIIRAKTSEATKGACTTIKLRCKYSTMSDKQIEKFNKAGITIEPEGEKNIFGRTRPKTFSFNGGDPIPAKDFYNKMVTDSDFRSAVRKAYNPKFAGFADKVWTKVKAKFGFKEGGTKAAKDAEERKKAIHEDAKNGIDGGDVKPAEAGKEDERCGGKCSPEQAQSINDANDKVKTGSSKKSVGQIAEKINGIKGVGSAISITGYMEYACQAYGAIKLTANLAKIVRSVQLARYAFDFVNTADMIKAGDATPENVSQLGEILTAASPGVDFNNQPRKTATDSFGYRYAAYGDTGMSSEYTTQFINGGGFGGQMSKTLGFVSGIIGGRAGAQKTCGTLANPIVQAGTIIIGLASIFTGVGAIKIIGQAALGVGIMAALLILPSIVGSIIAGDVTDGIQGEDSGDAIASGSGAFMSATANAGGNSPLTKDQALAYSQTQNEVAASYLKDEALALSPFDASNQYTFLGSITHSLLPYYSNNAFSLKNTLSSSMSLVGQSIKGVLPSTSALSASEQSAALDICQDFDYVDLKIAADPFCNPIFGIPPEYLDADPIAVADYLKERNWFTEGQSAEGDGNDYIRTTAYDDFVKNCIERTEPFGYSDVNTSGAEPDGADCKIEGPDAKLRAYAYIDYIDQRVEDGMDGYDIDSGVAASTTGGNCEDLLNGKWKIPTCSGPTGQERIPDMDGIMRDQGDTNDEPLRFGAGFLKIPESERKYFADYYITMRWRYAKWYWWRPDEKDLEVTIDQEQADYYGKNLPRVAVTNPKNGKSIVFAVIESGPGPSIGTSWRKDHGNKQLPMPPWWTDGLLEDPPEYDGIVSGITPVGMRALGITGDDLGYDANPNSVKLQYAWASDQKAKPGSVAINQTPGTTTGTDCSKATGNGRLVCSAKKYLGYKYFNSSCYGGNESGPEDGYPGRSWIEYAIKAGSSKQIDGKDLCIGCSGFVNVAMYDGLKVDTGNACSIAYYNQRDEFKLKLIKDYSMKPGETLQPGDIVIKHHGDCVGGGKGANHIGIVESYDAKTGEVHSLESSNNGSAQYTRSSDYWQIALRYTGT